MTEKSGATQLDYNAYIYIVKIKYMDILHTKLISWFDLKCQ